MQIQILLYDGFDELDAIGPYEVFDYAGDMCATIQVEYVTLTHTDRVTASHGTRVEPDRTLPDPTTASSPDLLLVPGGGGTPEMTMRVPGQRPSAVTFPARSLSMMNRAVSLRPSALAVCFLRRRGLLTTDQ